MNQTDVKYEEPDINNIIINVDLLVTEVYGKIIELPINKIKSSNEDYIIETGEHEILGDTFYSNCPFNQAVIRKPNGQILVGKEVKKSFLERFIHQENSK